MVPIHKNHYNALTMCVYVYMYVLKLGKQSDGDSVLGPSDAEISLFLCYDCKLMVGHTVDGQVRLELEYC